MKNFMKVVGIVIIFIAVIGFLQTCDDNGCSVDEVASEVLNRNLKDSDYSVNTSQGLTSYTIIVTPNIDVDYCNVSIFLYNSKDEVIFSDTMRKDYLVRGRSYSYTFDFGFINTLSGSYVKYNIDGEV